ncbi:MAG TPA: DUF3459 domain-containing protein [Sedimenticola sp.]|nr:DUF3459 domain-containing protein [Sedimenticola sp.]
MPAFYILSLLGTENDLEGVRRTGAARAINRHKWDWRRLSSLLDDPDSVQARVFAQLTELITLRRRQPAFHPDAAQAVPDFGPAIFAVERNCGRQRLLALHNVTAKPQRLKLPEGHWQELIKGFPLTGNCQLEPYGIAWLSRA